tara:strand:- start:2773 stop:2979 length:207 start_codon:yes stop_codon:yes gene_type:complete
LKNFLVIFSLSIISLSALGSSAFSTKDGKRKKKFMQKFESAYKFNTKTQNKTQIDQKFLKLFKKVSKK